MEEPRIVAELQQAAERDGLSLAAELRTAVRIYLHARRERAETR